MVKSMKKRSGKMCHRFFNNLANPTRLAVLRLLMDGPMSVNELAASLGEEQSMVSHNLKPLLKCSFVYIEKQGKKHLYSANQETLGTLFEAIENHAEKHCPTGGRCLQGED